MIARLAVVVLEDPSDGFGIGGIAFLVGLEVGDVDFERGVVHIRPNRWRLLKTKKSKRTVPLWPQLRHILAAHISAFGRVEGLLFPDKNGGMLGDLRGSLVAAVEAAEIEKRVTFTTLRHTYASTRIQTLDQGAPVSLYTVASEMGHAGVGLIESTYGHLQKIRHRSAVVEYVEADVVPLREHRAERRLGENARDYPVTHSLPDSLPVGSYGRT